MGELGDFGLGSKELFLDVAFLWPDFCAEFPFVTGGCKFALSEVVRISGSRCLSEEGSGLGCWAICSPSGGEEIKLKGRES